MSTHKPIVVVGSDNFDLVTRYPRSSSDISELGSPASTFRTFFGGKGAKPGSCSRPGERSGNCHWPNSEVRRPFAAGLCRVSGLKGSSGESQHR